MPDAPDRVSVVTTGPGKLEVRPEARPSPGPGEIVVRTLATGICGSDIHLFQGDHPYARYPLVQGHETVGRVAALGAGADPTLADALVVVEPTLECGSCAECARGAHNRCERLEVIGVQRPGSLAGRFVTRAGKVHRVPAGSDPASWALVEPVAVGCHAVSRGAIAAGDAIVVLGAGVIGLSIALAVASLEPRAVVVVEPSRERRRRVEELSLGTAVAPAEAGAALAALGTSGADVVFEATGVPAVLGAAHELARPGGRIVVVGQGAGPFSMPMIVMTRKELTLIGSRNSAGQFPSAIELLASSPGFVAAVVTHRFAPHAAADAFAELTSPGTAALKVLLEFSS
jgi:2-desacetyl-2-hydroxyethyl bacteriochlorophyllide A dehydrogenase